MNNKAQASQSLTELVEFLRLVYGNTRDQCSFVQITLTISILNSFRAIGIESFPVLLIRM